MKTYSTIQEIKADNKSINHSFFSPGAMRYFNSRVLNKVYKGYYFITSERYSDEDRKYTVRMCINGEIETIGLFNVNTKSECIKLINSLPSQFHYAFELAKNEFNGKSKKGEFLKHAKIELDNTKDINSISYDSFTGSCVWLLQNYKLTDHSFIKYFAEEVNL